MEDDKGCTICSAKGLEAEPGGVSRDSSFSVRSYIYIKTPLIHFPFFYFYHNPLTCSSCVYLDCSSTAIEVSACPAYYGRSSRSSPHPDVSCWLPGVVINNRRLSAHLAHHLLHTSAASQFIGCPAAPISSLCTLLH